MCGRFDNHIKKMHGWAELLTQWPSVSANQCSYNVAPTTQVPVLRRDTRDDEWTPSLMRWGMIPKWSKAFESQYATFNARIETVPEKPTFRDAWKSKRRCVIPMAGYYEWQTNDSGKQPFYITDPHLGCLMAAGLYEEWGADKQLSLTMLTQPAQSELRHVHARMPLLLTPETVETWMSPVNDSANELSVLPEIVFWPVSKAVGNTRNNYAELNQAIDL